MLNETRANVATATFVIQVHDNIDQGLKTATGSCQKVEIISFRLSAIPVGETSTTGKDLLIGKSEQHLQNKGELHHSGQLQQLADRSNSRPRAERHDCGRA